MPYNYLLAVAIISISMSFACFGTTDVAQADTAKSWTPSSMSALKSAIVDHANESRDPIIALFLRPDHFVQDIEIASALFLDTSTSDTRKSIYVAQLVPVEVDLIHVDVNRLYFRDQALKDGQIYRNQKITYAIDCAHSQVGVGDVEYYSSLVDGVSVKSLPAIHDEDIVRKIPKSGSVSDFILEAVCDGKVIYQPK